MGSCKCSLMGWTVTTKGSEKKKTNPKKTLIRIVDLLMGDEGTILTLALCFPDLF